MKLKVLLILVFVLFFSNGLFAQTQADDPVSLVERITGQIFTDVTENLDEYTANPEALEDLVRNDLMPLLDINYSARLILGRAGRGLPKEKIDEFATCMTNLLINRYSKSLLHFSSKIKLQVLPQRGDLNPKLTRVRTRISLPEGGEAPVDYAFHKTPEGWKAFDVVVEGISYVTTYRNQIMPEVQANGIDSVIERLSTGQMQLAE
ncbi:MAG: ABC transporter substrate-binding protein [Xanthomonadales bacterium]|nr:ABC transporter substrate-binding protein [Xanthomonadales bacterium]MDH4020687.1 ABC transporter substrate-binding protein [Xanthomonadales bacterium]